jgi:CheY-like chemotaxis protein
VRAAARGAILRAVSPRVLVCDDAPGFRLVMATALHEAGLEPLPPVGSWNEAIDVAAAEQPDAVIVDLWMPTYDADALVRLCAAAPGSLIFVVSVLPIDEAERVVDGVVRVAGIFSKPVPPHEIAERVRDGLAARR